MLYSLIALMRLVKWLIRSGGGTEHTQTHPKRANTDHTTPAMINPVFTPPWEINACLKPNKIPVSPELISNARVQSWATRTVRVEPPDDESSTN